MRSSVTGSGLLVNNISRSSISAIFLHLTSNILGFEKQRLMSKHGCMSSEAHVAFVSNSCSRLLCALHLQQEESNAWDLKPTLTSICKLCSMVTSFWFQLQLTFVCPSSLARRVQCMGPGACIDLNLQTV
ncbi:uncharacterized protein LOC120658106 isoform X3 [Panicum virgatum]|uniref:uncharacterized protein LOC120658106 isoform X3 n=1 Tax=Panicum virgatum TaxID=38727 RepID=UPI0019D6864A|nr:uncharacterized protein LOC120658106 isoform X3 [Panicum virgatum]